MKHFSRWSLLLISIFPALAPVGAFALVHAASAAPVANPFHYEFRIDGTVNESGSMDSSASPYWWINSGGQMTLSAGTGKTIQGNLPLGSYWQRTYAAANPLDTDNGLHPQNIFRLVSRNVWQNAQEEIHFKINAYNASASPNRDMYNGVLLFNRYVDSQNLYYTGVRVDGSVVIKKKKNGVYYTLAQQKVFPGTYNRITRPNLLPLNKWMAIRSRVSNNADGSVNIQLYMDKENNGVWTLVASARDDGRSFGGAAITQAGFGGIRSDFMDLEFDDFRFTNI
ncbi:MAG: hypothetical protein A3B90_00805 [Candidatus Magasanikbacteria bacterium RIFCSPHIGHO2_02_FULL_41_13]|uniref:Beta-xylosidase C-terminal Concanavalin A-like domain-containing protein n=1 Tax=Candidatus Magasanikbacteria bacterium RIFCSPHIGHO2_02_FULL_41_13 TaxID=1798676 RepID=A0A1F6M4M4_9BACT|nr:MAG: hypothetical protein A3B90_00805 [Candidatus Magasanikbacteria bacterium RIFCSPHIGHO2_02_FULL_41_13]